MRKKFHRPHFFIRSDLHRPLIRLILVNAAFICFVFILSIFVDFEELHGKISFLKELEYQAVVFITILLLEIGILVSVFGRWFYSQFTHMLDLKEAIKKGENEFMEFKSSLRWDYVENKINKDLEYVVAKTVCGFMNAEGGSLLIGIDDERKVLGLENDIKTLKKKNEDGFVLHLTQTLYSYIGKENSEFISINMGHFKGRAVCSVSIRPSTKPVYVKHEGKDEFFVRSSNLTQPMQIKEAHEYIKMHWKT